MRISEEFLQVLPISRTHHGKQGIIQIILAANMSGITYHQPAWLACEFNIVSEYVCEDRAQTTADVFGTKAEKNFTFYFGIKCFMFGVNGKCQVE